MIKSLRYNFGLSKHFDNKKIKATYSTNLIPLEHYVFSTAVEFRDTISLN